jgi:drug/metabolite transporter (DMT)-like permease
VTLLAIGLCLLCQVCEVSGHLFLKHGMNATNLVPRPWPLIIRNIAAALGFLTLWFLLWLGLLQGWDLSRLYPFEGLGPPLLMLGAWIFLKEHVPPRAWLGVLLIGSGIALVSIE